MSTGPIEFLSNFTSSRPGTQTSPTTVSCRTTPGSVITVTRGKLEINGFSSFDQNQRATWDLDRATLGLQLGVLCLVVPNDLSPSSTWIPIAQLRPEYRGLTDALRTFVTEARRLLGRALPAGQIDS